VRLPAAILLALAFTSVRPASASWPPWHRPNRAPPRYPEILVDAEWLANHRGRAGLTIVDARSRARYEQEHVAGAIPFDAAGADPDPGALGARLAQAGIPSEGTVVCYADTADPCAAGRLFWLLELAGCGRARVLNGGLEAWKKHGARTERGARPVPVARFAAAPDTSRIADFAYVMGAFGRPGHTLMDWRSPEDWDKGHVPHSLPFLLDRLAGPGGLWRDGPAMRLVFEDFGPRKRDYVDLNDEFVVFGDAPPGRAPIHPYLAARVAGLARVRCYPEGFAGWASHREAPVTRIVGAEELREHLGTTLWERLRRIPPRQVMLFDLRGDREYAWGHVPGAVSLPSWNFERDLEATVSRRWPQADRARMPLVCYCYGVDCVRSRNCTTIAAQHGYLNLWWFRDGIPGWQAAGLALEKGK
jgi:thiosulfate/3-mercaptopyruvate sulfurtransferase